jgi:hypothetical protein
MTKLEELNRTHDAKLAARRVAYTAWKDASKAADAAEAAWDAYDAAWAAEVAAWVALQKEAKKSKENNE